MTSIRTWQQALDLHIDYADWAKRNREVLDILAGTRYARGFIDVDSASTEDLERAGGVVSSNHRIDDLLECPTFFLTSDMGKVALASSQDVPSYPLDLSDAFAPTGFAVLADPLVQPHRESVDVIAWTSRDDMLIIHCMADGGVPPGPRLAPFPPSPWIRGAGYHQTATVDDPTELVTIEDDATRERTVFVRRYLSALFALMRQELPAVESPVAPRALGKRATRQFGPDHKTKVITLRKRKKPWRPDKEEGGADRVYTHRWLVNGFWRQHYYPSLGGPCRLPDGSKNPANHRPIRIGDYIKGPEHLPLIIKPTVYKVSR